MDLWNLVDKKEIESVINQQINKISKISLGYTNRIYLINEQYVLRTCVNPHNFKNFCRASEFCQKYQNQVNCPRLISAKFDVETKTAWQVEERVNGINLSEKWIRLSAQERDFVIRKICESLKQLHEIPILEVFENSFSEDDWMKKFQKDIAKKEKQLAEKGISNQVFKKIENYLIEHSEVLLETDYKVCHTDLHFDNIMIDNALNIVFVDYDRLRISSLDYELDIINDMCHTPQLVLSNSTMGCLETNDFTEVLPLMKKYYPELFDFTDMNIRLAIYSIKHYLASLGYAKDKNQVFGILNSIVEENK